MYSLASSLHSFPILPFGRWRNNRCSSPSQQPHYGRLFAPCGTLHILASWDPLRPKVDNRDLDCSFRSTSVPICFPRQRNQCRRIYGTHSLLSEHHVPRPVISALSTFVIMVHPLTVHRCAYIPERVPALIRASITGYLGSANRIAGLAAPISATYARGVDNKGFICLSGGLFIFSAIVFLFVTETRGKRSL